MMKAVFQARRKRYVSVQVPNMRDEYSEGRKRGQQHKRENKDTSADKKQKKTYVLFFSKGKKGRKTGKATENAAYFFWKSSVQENQEIMKNKSSK